MRTCSTRENFPSAPLWNRAITTATYTTYSSSSLDAETIAGQLDQPAGSSKVCLSCHDGTLAISSVNVLAGQFDVTIPITGAGPGDTMPAGEGLLTGFTRNLGTDLSNDHPISLTYDTTLANIDGELRDPATSSDIGVRSPGVRPQFPLEATGPANEAQIQCVSCHDPHQWSPDHGKQEINVDITKLDGDGSNSFLRIANNEEGALCKNCHRDQAPVANSRHNLEISAPEEKNKDGMSVSRSGVCSACHVPHNGSGKNMWARTVAKNAKDIMSKCIDCHANGKVAEDKTTGKHSHPLHVNLDSIDASTDLPLFAKDGGRDENHGLVDCATCHDPHQSPNEFMLRGEGS